MMTESSLDDPDLPLIHAINEGDVHALQCLYERHGAGILSFLIDRLHDRQLAEEVLQDVMLAVWKAAPTFRGECKVRTWLLSIARHHAIDAYHHCEHQEPPLTKFNDCITSDFTNVLATVEKNLLHEQLVDTFAKLPTRQREVVKLTFYHGLTCAEVADVLGVPLGTVKSRLYHARQTMRRLLQMEGITHA